MVTPVKLVISTSKIGQVAYSVEVAVLMNDAVPVRLDGAISPIYREKLWLAAISKGLTTVQSIISIVNVFVNVSDPTVAVIVTEVNASASDESTEIFPTVSIETPAAVVIENDDTVHALSNDVVSPVRSDGAKPVI